MGSDGVKKLPAASDTGSHRCRQHVDYSRRVRQGKEVRTDPATQNVTSAPRTGMSESDVLHSHSNSELHTRKKLSRSCAADVQHFYSTHSEFAAVKGDGSVVMQEENQPEHRFGAPTFIEDETLLFESIGPTPDPSSATRELRHRGASSSYFRALSDLSARAKSRQGTDWRKPNNYLLTCCMMDSWLWRIRLPDNFSSLVVLCADEKSAMLTSTAREVSAV